MLRSFVRMGLSEMMVYIMEISGIVKQGEEVAIGEFRTKRTMSVVYNEMHAEK